MRMTCSEPHHTFRYIGRMERDAEGDGPKAGWLTWKSDIHEPSTEGIVYHYFAIDPEKFWAAP